MRDDKVRIAFKSSDIDGCACLKILIEGFIVAGMKISEIFYSIQGEGGLVGMPSVFIRTAGCNLYCDWCDSKHAWDEAASEELSVPEIMDRIAVHDAGYCVLTGGEPMIAAGIHELAAELDRRGVHTTIETNATAPPNGIRCHLASLSPKLDGAADEPVRAQIEIVEEWLVSYDSQFKFVIRDPEQVDLVERFLDSLPLTVAPERIFLMPEGATLSELESRAEMLAGLCRRHGYRYGQRLHLRLFGGRRGM